MTELLDGFGKGWEVFVPFPSEIPHVITAGSPCGAGVAINPGSARDTLLASPCLNSSDAWDELWKLEMVWLV